MSTQPFFSIILPTRNRSSVICNAIDSVINQTFMDWELLVIDNDTTEDTRAVVSRYTDERVRYFRTGNLSMHDNWEYGINQCMGRFITVLEDKAQLIPDALETLSELFRQYNVPIICWATEDLVVEDKEPTRTIYTSEQVLQLFLSHSDQHSWKVIPRFANSACEAAIVAKSRSTPVGRVFSPISPDFTSAFLQLALYDNLLYLDKVLAKFDMKFSNGKAFSAKRLDSPDMKDFVKLTLDGDINNLCKLVPIKAPYILHNGVYNDYLNLRSKLGGRLQYHPLDIINYYNQCIRSIKYAEARGADMTFEREELKTALSKECNHVQYCVNQLNNMGVDSPKGNFFESKLFDIRIKELVKSKKTIAIWGAGEIGDSLLKSSDTLAQNLNVVVDGNPEKYGTLMPYWGFEIQSPVYLIEHPVDVIIVASLSFGKVIVKDIREKYKIDSEIIWQEY